MLKQLCALVAAGFCLAGPFPGAQAPAPAQTPARDDAASSMFARDRVLQIDIDLPPADWREIRLTHRDGADENLANLAEDGAYEYRAGDIRIDGVRVARVGIRKKGLLGSVVSTRPSLKVKFDEFVDNQRFSGLDGLTLNNNNQDQALIQAFLAYDLFARAGVPTPRANFAHVRVNGEDLGVYTHVEAIGRPFLRRVFGSDNGVLYESYAGDFTAETRARIVEKSGGRNQDRTRLDALTALLAASGPVSLARVEELVDMNTFMRMWAIESLMGHWDSYSANSNNYYLYTNPATRKLHFIPWGPDSIFDDPGPLQPAVVPKSFKAMGILSRRLWELPEIRDRYRELMKTLLADTWNEARLIGDMSALQKALQPQSTMLPETVEAAAARISQFIQARRTAVEAELTPPGPEWPSGAAPSSAPVPMTITGSFTAPWQRDAPLDPLSPGTAELGLEVGGTPMTFNRVGAYSTTHKQGDPTPIAAIREKYQAIMVTGLSGGRVWQVFLTIDPLLLESGLRQLPVDHFAVWAIVVTVEASTPRLRIFGVVGDLKLEEVSARDGGTLRGGFTLRGMAP